MSSIQPKGPQQPLPNDATRVAKPARPAGQVKASKEEIAWGVALEKKTTQGYVPTEDEKAQYNKIAEKLLGVDNASTVKEKAADSTKGLLDYPKDLVTGIANYAFKSMGHNAVDISQSKAELSDNFSAAVEGFKKGKLDDAIESTIDSFGSLFDVANDRLAMGASALTAGLAGGVATIVDGVDQGAEWVGDKLAENPDNEWAKTGASIVRLVGGENSNENLSQTFAKKTVEGMVESLDD